MESQPHPALGAGSMRESFNPKVDVSVCILDHLSIQKKKAFLQTRDIEQLPTSMRDERLHRCGIRALWLAKQRRCSLC
jgi:hypothetical protein